MIINGFEIEENLASILADTYPRTVYMIDERSDVYARLEDAMEEANRLKPGWTGPVNVCAYANNIVRDGSGELALADECFAPLEFTGDYWEV